ncbi:leucine/isoleucine/valine transporter ATP-binding subunit [compost metagenome]
MPEGRGIFPKLTVHENLEMGAFSRRDGKDAIGADIEHMYGIFPRLKERAFPLLDMMRQSLAANAEVTWEVSRGW